MKYPCELCGDSPASVIVEIKILGGPTALCSRCHNQRQEDERRAALEGFMRSRYSGEGGIIGPYTMVIDTPPRGSGSPCAYRCIHCHISNATLSSECGWPCYLCKRLNYIWSGAVEGHQNPEEPKA